MRKIIFYLILFFLLIIGCKKDVTQNTNPAVPDADKIIPTFTDVPTESIYGAVSMTKEQYEAIPKLTEQALSSLPDLDPTLSTYPRAVIEPIVLQQFPPCMPFGQGHTGSCYAWSISAIETYYYFKETGMVYANYYKSFPTIDESKIMSPAFIYYYIKQMRAMNSNKCVQYNLLDTISKKGVCSWKSFPFNNAIDDVPAPSQAVLNEAKLRVGKVDYQIYTIENISTIKEAISKGYPVEISVYLNREFDNLNRSNSNWILSEQQQKMSKEEYLNQKYKDKTIDGVTKDVLVRDAFHGMVVYGFDDAKKAFLVRNSWGIGFGNNGDCWIPYSTLSHPGVLLYVTMSSKNVKEIIKSNATLIADLNPSFNYIPTVNTDDYLKDPTSSYKGNIVNFNQTKQTRAELPMQTAIASKGTIEMEVFVKNGYGYYSGVLADNTPAAYILSSDCSGTDVKWPGSMNFFVTNTGNLVFQVATTKGVNGYGQTIVARNTGFKFNEWHKISISYGDKGMVIRLDEKNVAVNTTFTQPISTGGAPDQANDKFTVGEPFSYYYAKNNWNEKGFEGYISRFRTSSRELDWQINGGSDNTLPTGSTDITSGLIGYYPFNGNANDESGKGNNGIVSGATITNDKNNKANSAYKFGGMNAAGYIRVSNNSSLQLSRNATFSVWFRLDSYVGSDGFYGSKDGGPHCLIAKDGDRVGFNIMISQTSTNFWTRFLNNSYIVPTFDIGFHNTTDYLGKWTHLAYTIDDGLGALYLNGVLISTQANPIIDFTRANTSDFIFGMYGNNGGINPYYWYPFNGVMDNVRIYNRTLSDSEIQAIYNTEK